MRTSNKLDGADSEADDLSSSPVHDTVQGCGTCWIELRLVDGHEPVGDREYWIRLPDGEERKGTLDDQGKARLEDIPCGVCLVRFPRTDLEDWQPVVGLPPERSAWVEVALHDHDGTPVAGERFEVTDSAGVLHEGTLGDDGHAKLDGIAAGTCHVRFPDREGEDVAVASG